MTSAWKEPPGRDDRAEGQHVALDENQLELFEIEPRASTDAALPSELDSTSGAAQGGGRPAEMMAAEASARDFPDVGGVEPGSVELRRLEDSIRWLMNESNVRRMPAAAPLWPVRGLPPVASVEDDFLLLDPHTLLNPDTLFPQQSPRGRSSVFRGAAKMLLVSAVAAPTAYFVATWMQLTGSTTPTDPAAMSDSATISSSATALGSSEQRIAAVPLAQTRPPPEAAQAGDDVSATRQPEAMASREVPRVETSPEVTADAGVAEPKGAPGQSAAPPDPAPNIGGISAASAARPDTPAPPATAKPARNPQEIALLVERGRALFDAGDVVSARLFFRRAANAGDAAAAVAMGATYDPDILAKRFIRGIEADAQEAREWYEKARLLGSPEGPRRIEMLAQRQAR
jgi:hypothetical protein